MYLAKQGEHTHTHQHESHDKKTNKTKQTGTCMRTLPSPFSLSLTHSLSLSHTHTLPFSLSLSHSLTRSLTHSFSHTLSLFPSTPSRTSKPDLAKHSPLSPALIVNPSNRPHAPNVTYKWEKVRHLCGHSTQPKNAQARHLALLPPLVLAFPSLPHAYRLDPGRPARTCR